MCVVWMVAWLLQGPKINAFEIFSSLSIRLVVIRRHTAQLFTSLIADLRQDINRVSSFSRCLNGTFTWRNCSVKALVSYFRREDLYLLFFSFGLMYHCLNGAISSRKCSIKTPAKWRNSLYVLMKICHQRSNLLGPIFTWQVLNSSLPWAAVWSCHNAILWCFVTSFTDGFSNVSYEDSSILLR